MAPVRALVALFASVALLLAITPTHVGASDAVDSIGLAFDTDVVDEETSSPNLDDDVVHSVPTVCAPRRVVRLAREVRSDEREGVTHDDDPRPPRAC